MNRRGFFGLVLGAIAAPFVPRPPAIDVGLGEPWWVAWRYALPPEFVGAWRGGGKTATLMDYAARLDPDERVDTIIAMLNETNELLDDVRWTRTAPR